MTDKVSIYRDILNSMGRFTYCYYEICTVADHHIDIHYPPHAVNGANLENDDILLLCGQHDPRQNGLWKYTDKCDPCLERPEHFPSGLKCHHPLVVDNINAGQCSKKLVFSDQYEFIVDEDPVTFSSCDHPLLDNSNKSVAGMSSSDISKSEAIFKINEYRKEHYQKPLDPEKSLWTKDDVMAEYKRLFG